MGKQKSIKIKRSKGRLYKKKKSAGRKIVETLALIVVVGGLIFVGYSAAGPLISHLSGGGESDSSVSMWTPDESTLNSGTNAEDTSESPTESEKAPVSDGIGAYLLSETAMQSSSSLNSALSAAKKSGFNIVLIPVKTTEGNILYTSNVSYIKDTGLITGTLSAAQIAGYAKTMGLTPKAVLPTLLDSKSSAYIEDTGYSFADGSGWSWLDAAAESGGKRWMDPFLTGTKKYYFDLSKELIGAGFEEVILSELRYPDFADYDQRILDARNFTSDRYKSLTAVYNSAFSASEKKASVSVNAKDVLDGYGKSYGRTAEILTDKSFSGTVYLTVDLSDFGTELKTGEDTSIKLSPDPVKKSEGIINKAVEYIGTNVTIVPVIRGEGLSAGALAECYKNLMAR